MNPIVRVERGWPGHFICADRCLFRRNTLLEYGNVHIIVSTVGAMRDLFSDGFMEIGLERYYETMAFHAKHNGKYWDADVTKQISFISPWTVSELSADDKANDMHEAVVNEIVQRLVQGEQFDA